MKKMCQVLYLHEVEQILISIALFSWVLRMAWTEKQNEEVFGLLFSTRNYWSYVKMNFGAAEEGESLISCTFITLHVLSAVYFASSQIPRNRAFNLAAIWSIKVLKKEVVEYYYIIAFAC